MALSSFTDFVNSQKQPTQTTKGATDQGLLGQFATGAGKGIISSITGAAALGERGLQLATKPFLPKEAELTGAASEELVPEELRTPQTPAEKAGFAVEQIAEFFFPAGLASKGIKGTEALLGATKLTGKGLGAAKIGGRAAIGAGELAGVESIQSGGKPEDLKGVVGAAILGGAIPIVGGLVGHKLAGLSGRLAKGIETKIIKPTARDLKNGFKIDNIFKYKLGGSLETTALKTHQKIQEASKALSNLVGGSKASVNVAKIIKNVEKEVESGKLRNFGSIEGMKRSLNNFKEEISQLDEISSKGVMNLVDAQAWKRSVGNHGAWLYGARDPESKASEAVANIMYTQIRAAIERAAPKELKDMNKILSELIPIEQALIRRVPIADRQNMLGLGDIVTLLPSFANPSNLWFFTLNKLSKSGTVANYLKAIDDLKFLPEARGGIRELLFGSPAKKADDLGTSIKGTTTEIKPLVQEARKFKSADEFVEAQGKPLYHGTTRKTGEALQDKGTGLYGDGFYFATEPKRAEIYARQGGKEFGQLVEATVEFKKPFKIDVVGGKADDSFFISKNDFEKIKEISGLKIGDSRMFRTDLLYSDLKRASNNPNDILKKAGFDGIQTQRTKVAFDKDVIKTKSQLEQIWKEAQK